MITYKKNGNKNSNCNKKMSISYWHTVKHT
jgi:hypothetical protein